jgi:periplasmic protein TonB
VEIFSVSDIAAATGVPVSRVADRILRTGVPTAHGYVREDDALALVRAIAAGEPVPSDHPTFGAVVVAPERRGLFGLMTSGALHVLAATIVIVASFGWLTAASAEREPDATPARLVYLMTPGPGGGGGGGGIKIPAPPRRAERKAPAPRPVSSPVPEVRTPPPPPEPKPEPKVEPPPPPPTPPVVAPVVPKPADPVDTPGVLAPPPDPRTANQGNGAGGGAGTGSGTGVGEGTGPGIGPGTGGGEGGGPYQPGAGIEPPSLQREVKATYTDDARRRGIEGDVVLEIVVRRDGSVGDARVKRSLDRGGLDQRAIEAVRQWRFAPARRHGVPVDVVVEVAVEFKLR